MVPACTVHVTVLQFFGCGGPNFDYFHRKM
jgi:hypothetical protein